MNTLARREGIRWLVTTSRRTGAEAEARLRAGLDSAVVAAAVWWAEKPEKKMQAFLGAAECVFVTQDSVTMVTEAVASGRPVVVVRPELTVFPNNSFAIDYFMRLEASRRIARSRIVSITEFEPGKSGIQLRDEEFVFELAGRLLSRLK